MVEDSKIVKEEKKIVNDGIEFEDRIDESAIDAFKGMGYTKRLSDQALLMYKTFKTKKDKIQPGRLSAEGYAFIATLIDLIDKSSGE